MKRIVVLPETKADLADTRRWYDRQRRGVGAKFLDRVKEALHSIARAPESFRRIEGSRDRVHHVRGFPFIILYRVEVDRVVVFSVIHGRRDPGTWPTGP